MFVSKGMSGENPMAWENIAVQLVVFGVGVLGLPTGSAVRGVWESIS